MELISKDSVVSEIRWILGSKYFSDNNRETIYEILLGRIDYLPTEESTVHALWTDTYKNGYKPCNCVICNNCDKVSLAGETNYCPNCGAKMEKK